MIVYYNPENYDFLVTTLDKEPRLLDNMIADGHNMKLYKRITIGDHILAVTSTFKDLIKAHEREGGRGLQR